jgi:cob(I)alamin adenosyltransferase
MSKQGLLLVYTGQGKGKTTAALGLIFRALGYGHKVGVVQFIKGKRQTGEWRYADTIPGLEFHVMGKGFTWESDDLSRDKRAACLAWEKVKELIGSGDYNLVILDEMTYAINYGFLDLAEVLDTMANRPPELHVVVTGRNAPEELVEAADLVTEMNVVKHPFADQGIRAQLGLDF